MRHLNKKVKVQVSNLTKSFGDLLVLNNVSFEVYEGEFLCIVGPTGCGKTTFLNSLTHLYEPTSGQILFEGEKVNLRKHNITYIFQEYSAMEWLTVRQNVRFGLELKKNYDDIDKKVDDALELVGLTEFANYYPKQLSASMLQRVVIARAFATQPELLLMDEPYGQLDINLRFKLEDEVVRLCKQTNTTVIFITHNIEEAVYLGDRILVLTNKPTSIKEIVTDDLPRPRDIAEPEFVAMRNRITDLIKWW
ncbi:ABC transporter ATP-binding protein [uncultured Desulfovibrio sp.]|uniref:ABC transporter ATP-binding protein n=1 Tax=uncultured Desulfovibrio sp. TaxID=167968 RepID=UPI002617D4E1|nr:ABC transporter ATP-binding protein [uncultured Desulfovibrio sp.]